MSGTSMEARSRPGSKIRHETWKYQVVELHPARRRGRGVHRWSIAMKKFLAGCVAGPVALIAVLATFAFVVRTIDSVDDLYDRTQTHQRQLEKARREARWLNEALNEANGRILSLEAVEQARDLTDWCDRLAKRLEVV